MSDTVVHLSWLLSTQIHIQIEIEKAGLVYYRYRERSLTFRPLFRHRERGVSEHCLRRTLRSN